MFRFSIRDLLWLTLVVAMGLGWFVRERQLREEARATEARMENKLRLVEDSLDAGFGLRMDWDEGRLRFKLPIQSPR